MTDTDIVKGFEKDVRQSILSTIANLVKQLRIEEFKEDYNEETQTRTFEIAFNEGSIRTIEIILDIDPDGK